ncbi:MAG: thiosulfate oxidation carrier complex protein SoxZ [Gammaproteobacteria bacterium]|nr:thiosulfate oxidation carrier complex protein SoxZ [Gammaproteobacteria bacterium]MCK5090899.1 thiosulfate oxidation carrier complex protein SoxZ [Gammaproteobacteria bacterium]
MAKKWKVRANLKGDVTTVKALITHPMETGMRKNKKTGKKVPAHYIQDLVAEHNGKKILNADWGPAVSANPYISFKFKGAKVGDKVKLSWVDNKGKSDSHDVAVK